MRSLHENLSKLTRLSKSFRGSSFRNVYVAKQYDVAWSRYKADVTTFGLLRSAQANSDWTTRIGKTSWAVTKFYVTINDIVPKKSEEITTNHFAFRELNAQNKEAKFNNW